VDSEQRICDELSSLFLHYLPFDHATAPLRIGGAASLLTATRRDDHVRYPCRHMPKAARVLAALKRDGWTETRRRGSHRVLVKDDRQRIWAYHEGVDLGGPAMARIAKDYGYTLAELRKL
jgi:predicted RNA binding protein YcfA (HicA-like mRNA interferase family)